MNTLRNKRTTSVSARSVDFLGNLLCIRLNDGRELRISLETTPWLRWLRDAKPQQRANWSLEPGGFAVYWEDLDDGIEIAHLLEMQTPSSPTETPEITSELRYAGVA
jgi:hypothetical protein